MPTYEYQCEACGKIIEAFHGMKESGPKTCTCEARGRLRRLVSSGSGLIFKGSGFYITDYSKKHSGGEPASSSSSSSSAPSSTPDSASCKAPAESKKTESCACAATKGSSSN